MASGTTEKKRAKYLDNRDLALSIQARGLKKVQKEVGGRIDAVRASKIVNLLRDMGYDDKSINAELKELAGQKKETHTGGPVTPAAEGEEREYEVGKNGRIGLSVRILDKGHKDKVRVRFSKKGIRILP